MRYVTSYFENCAIFRWHTHNWFNSARKNISNLTICVWHKAWRNRKSEKVLFSLILSTKTRCVKNLGISTTIKPRLIDTPWEKEWKFIDGKRREIYRILIVSSILILKLILKRLTALYLSLTRFFFSANQLWSEASKNKFFIQLLRKSGTFYPLFSLLLMLDSRK